MPLNIMLGGKDERELPINTTPNTGTYSYAGPTSGNGKGPL